MSFSTQVSSISSRSKRARSVTMDQVASIRASTRPRMAVHVEDTNQDSSDASNSDNESDDDSSIEWIRDPREETTDPVVEKSRISEAVVWLQENPKESAVTAARIFKCRHSRSVRLTVQRLFNPSRDIHGQLNTRGGNNRILTDAQEGTIYQYCYNQWQMGLGAIKQMVFGAVKHLCTADGKEPPSWRWFSQWLKSNTALHSIKTKPIERSRLESHTEAEVQAWFEDYHATLARYKITKPKYVLNMDESGVRVGCPSGEEVVVPDEVADLYTASPENRESVTIFETIYAGGKKPPILPLVICPGVKVMDNWIHDYLTGDKAITTSPTGYTNDKVVMDYLDHLILNTKASASKHWILFFMDGHLTHEYPDFVVKAAEHHIALHVFPSHLTHALQPLDVGVFRPWKHYHNKAIQNAIRSFDFEYTILSFFRDLSTIRKETMKPYTITNSFRESGMWPVNAKAGINKMRQYVKGTKAYRKKKLVPDSPKLPVNPMSQSEHAISEWIERDPRTWSSPSRQRHTNTLKNVKVQLSYAHLIDAEH